MQRFEENALQAERLAERFRKMRSKLGFARQEDFASRLGRSRNSISAYERGQAAPDGETLMRLAQLGVNIQWLLTGEGSMLTAGEPPATAPAAPASAPIDEELHALVVDGITAVYKEEGARLPPRDLGRLAARIHGDLVAAYDDPDDRKVALKLALQQLRRDLHSAPSDTQGKRSA